MSTEQNNKDDQYAPKYRGKMGPYVAMLLQGPGVSTADGQKPINMCSMHNILMYPSVALYMPMCELGRRLRTVDEYQDCLRHVILTMGGFGMIMPLESGQINVKPSLSYQAFSNMSLSFDKSTLRITKMNNLIDIRPGYTPGKSTFVLGHEMMHLWLLVNGIQPAKKCLREAVCNAMGVVVYTSMHRRHMVNGGDYGTAHSMRYEEEIQECYNLVRDEMNGIQENRSQVISQFMMELIRYTPEPLVHSAVVCIYNVLNGYTRV